MAESGTYDPETIASRQRIADQLLLQAAKPREIRSRLQGLGQMGETAIYGFLSGQDEKERREGTAAQAGAIAALLGGAPSAAPAATPLPSPTAANDTAAAPPTTLVGNNPDYGPAPRSPTMATVAGTEDTIPLPQRNPIGALNPEFRSKFADLRTAAGDKGAYFDAPEQGSLGNVRSPQQQAALYAQGRTAPGPIVTGTTNSNHITGRALDVVPTAGTPESKIGSVVAALTAKDPRFSGMRSGATFSNLYDPLHVELNKPQGTQVASLNPSAGVGADAEAPTVPQPPAPVQVAQNAPAGLPAPADNKAAIAKMLQDKNPYVRKLGISLGQNLITKQLEGDKPTDEMREYSLYRQQGGKDSFFDYKSGLKKAGAQNIALNNTVNPIVKGVGERFNDSMDTAKASIPQIQGIHEARRALDEGAITGLGADPKLFLAKAANLFGLDEKAAANTEVARSAIGNSVLAKAKTLGANPSNTDRDYIEKVVGGQIGLEEGSIRRLLDMQEKWARQSIQRANAEGAKLLKAQPKELDSIAPLLSVTEPPSYEEFLKANPRSAPAAAAPGAAPKIRTYNPATGKIE